MLDGGKWKYTTESVTNRNKASWMDVAMKEQGVREVPYGSNSGPRVDEYLKSAGAPSPNAWCGAFCHWSFKQVNMKGAGASAKNWSNWGQKLDEPKYGAFAVFNKSHVGFYVGTNKNGNYSILHGNWGHKVELSTYIKPSEIKEFRYPN